MVFNFCFLRCIIQNNGILDNDGCGGLTEIECHEQIDDNGDRKCSYNKLHGECFAIVRASGTKGYGNFDDGYIDGQAQANEEKVKFECLLM